MGFHLKFKTKNQLLLFIRSEGEEFAELVRQIYNEHLLAKGKIRKTGSFKELLVSFSSLSKDILEDVVNSAISGDYEDEDENDYEDGDEEEDGEEYEDIDEGEDDDDVEETA